ncbi:hypothetical protein H5410_015939 [Solanum commersonii]|uniref:Uncharacterized protein n=1 Tax=Solanum commersonii TaxID=4109 RepID=A0A9J5ZVK8_SOLCO|nr:hypothetical protein H5410_015939 [Solanum commersonii]
MSSHGESNLKEVRNQRLGFDFGDNTTTYCEGEQKSSKKQTYTSYIDEDDTPLPPVNPSLLLLISLKKIPLLNHQWRFRFELLGRCNVL